MLTDSGLCVALNVAKEDRLTLDKTGRSVKLLDVVPASIVQPYLYMKVINSSGSQFGMTLVLNTEQYQYTRGPLTDIGVKVWTLHILRKHQGTNVRDN